MSTPHLDAALKILRDGQYERLHEVRQHLELHVQTYEADLLAARAAGIKTALLLVSFACFLSYLTISPG